MATFLKETFDAARYAAARATYPRKLYDFVLHFHAQSLRARWDTALDLGCGTGQAIFELTLFCHIVGADTSPRMAQMMLSISETASLPAGISKDQLATMRGCVQLVESNVEELWWREDGSVYMIVATQAAHWFNWTKLWPEAARVFGPGGSLAV